MFEFHKNMQNRQKQVFAYVQKLNILPDSEFCYDIKSSVHIYAERKSDFLLVWYDNNSIVPIAFWEAVTKEFFDAILPLFQLDFIQNPIAKYQQVYFRIFHFVDGEPEGFDDLNVFQAIQFTSSAPRAQWIYSMKDLIE